MQIVVNYVDLIGDEIPTAKIDEKTTLRATSKRRGHNVELMNTTGDVDLAAIGSVLSDPARCRVLLALGDGRSLCASVLAEEAGVTPSTTSTHLAKLVDAGLLTAATRGRFRYFTLAGPQVGELIETVARLAPAQPVRSLRQGTRAHAVRRARACYDHLAGRLGVALTEAMVERGILAGDNTVNFERTSDTRPVGWVQGGDGLTLTAVGRKSLTGLGVVVPPGDLVRCCVDWTEQRHHISGAHGRAVLARFIDLGWLRRGPAGRAVFITDAGEQGLERSFGLATAEV
ncbi:MAG TPA: metalloregulator ArsR/SmtB family transcription factor [Mycobacteriales bacterium]|jgi:DNA-binding transcriptional ArsR family regulator|nr:metalloregulator ArsR/SmtB family transcription factor [Mycobacteriales bacterium]